MSEQAWDNFLVAAQGGQPDQVPVALGADCGFIASAFGMNTLDFFLYPDRWLHAYLTLIARFPAVVFLPGFWVEYGMAAEPSAFGAPVLWRQDEAPAIRHLALPLADWRNLPRPDPYADGLMALVLRRIWNLEQGGELPEPHRLRFVAARGPFTIATHLFGATNFLTALAGERNDARLAADALEVLTETSIRFLQAQLGYLREPWGVMVLDDTVGMLSPALFNAVARPLLERIFATFDGLIRIYHNDTPCQHLLPHFPGLGFEVFHLSHRVPLAQARAALGPDIALMGNVPPLEVMAHGTPQQVAAAAHDCIVQVDGSGLILAPGGGTNAGTPARNIDALVSAALY
jgi:uroporphyrinogen decarboxylase